MEREIKLTLLDQIRICLTDSAPTSIARKFRVPKDRIHSAEFERAVWMWASKPTPSIYLNAYIAYTLIAIPLLAGAWVPSVSFSLGVMGSVILAYTLLGKKNAYSKRLRNWEASYAVAISRAFQGNIPYATRTVTYSLPASKLTSFLIKIKLLSKPKSS